MTAVREPAKRPCGSCPYRCDVPSGVWAADEYEKLADYDRPTPEQPVGVFLCHQGNGRLCSGWVGVHDMAHSLALRLAVALGHLPAAVEAAALSYVSPVPLFASGAEAAAHGLRDLAEPGSRAQRHIAKFLRKAEQ